MRVIYFSLKIIFLFFCFGFFGKGVLAESFDLSAPWHTELIEKNIDRSEEGVLSGVFRYTSRLSKKRIVDFYRRDFLSQGFSEERSDSPHVFVFEGDHKKRTLMFAPFLEETTKYSITFYEASREFVKELESYEVLQTRTKSPKSLDFMPLYSGLSAQLEYIVWEDSAMLSVGYLSNSDSSRITDFYLKNMSRFGWRLAERKDSDNIYSIEQWISMVAPFTTFCTDCPGVLPVEVPPLRLRGTELIFRKRQQKCVITVYTFDDILEKARGTVYEEGVENLFGRHGTTIIGVAYFY